MTVFIGIDPGLVSGAIGAIDHNGKFLYCGDIHSDCGRITFSRLRNQILDCIPRGDTAQIVIEDVHTMPGQGIASSGRFMRAAGAIEAIAYLTAVTHMVSPQRWKHDMCVDGDKEYSLESAREMWPEAELKLKKHHGRAEALLIAEWLRREFS